MMFISELVFLVGEISGVGGDCTNVDGIGVCFEGGRCGVDVVAGGRCGVDVEGGRCGVDFEGGTVDGRRGVICGVCVCVGGALVGLSGVMVI